MSIISEFSSILEESKRKYLKEQAGDFRILEEAGEVSDGANMLALGDNLPFMKYLLDERNMAGKLKLIYIDPPFFSRATYDAVINLKLSSGEKLPPVKHFAYDDVWQKDMSGYLSMLCCRLFAMRELLSDEGTLWVHLDWHASHYAKVLLDEIFGEENFVNEIIWQYKSGGSGKRHFARKHDTILVYSKSKKYYFAPPKEKSYNRGFKPYRFKGVKEYSDEKGWYTMVTMKDVWQVDMVGRTSGERTGYATQKPEALLERIVECATGEGDLCADFFCGSCTLGAVAGKLGRRWICCDESPLAVSAGLKRLHEAGPIEVLAEKNGRHCKTGESAGCRAEFSAACDKLPGADKLLVRVTFENYFMERLPESLDDKGLRAVKRAVSEEPAALLEYWSVDFDYDGKVFRPSAFMAKDKSGLQMSCEKLMPERKDLNKICIKTVDVFGNCIYTVL